MMYYTTDIVFGFGPVSECKAPSEIPMYDINWVIKNIHIHLQTNTSNDLITKVWSY